MSNNVLGILLSIMAGMATFVGALIIVFTKNTGDKKMTFILGFSAGVMLMVAIADLIPESRELLVSGAGNIKGLILLFLGILLGFLATDLLDQVSPSS